MSDNTRILEERMSDNSEYKYDVAFSFLAKDEALATELNDLLADRLRTFLYSKKQGEIAGTDGEETFNDVFRQEARMVVVLYRSNWGQTPWTRIEETAIRNRAYNEGYNFVKFVVLDELGSVPQWLPKTQIWIGLKRWGIPGAASVIEARVAELGGEPNEETVAQRAARLQRTLEFRKKRELFLTSSDGAGAANAEFDALRTRLEELIASLKSSRSIPLVLRFNAQQIVVLGLLQGLNIQWRGYYTNTLADARLNVELWDGHPPYPGIQYDFGPPNKLDTQIFTFDILPNEQYCWRSVNDESRTFRTEDFASFLIKYFMDKADSRDRERSKPR
jgi:hypothetical protein